MSKIWSMRPIDNASDYLCNSYSMDTSAFPDMYARSLRPQARGLRAYIYDQAKHGPCACLTNMLHFWHS